MCNSGLSSAYITYDFINLHLGLYAKVILTLAAYLLSLLAVRITVAYGSLFIFVLVSKTKITFRSKLPMVVNLKKFVPKLATAYGSLPSFL